MDEKSLKEFAAQLKKPTGEFGIKVGAIMNEGNRLLNQLTIESLALKQNDRVLEIGMGNGFFVQDILAASHSIHYTGCDYSEAMVAQANEINRATIVNDQAIFVLADVAHLPFPPARFNKIFTANTIYFWNNPSIILQELHRVLTNAGQLTIAIRPRSIMEKFPFIKNGFTMYDKNELLNLLLKNHFNPSKTIERNEPDQVINGQHVQLATLIVEAQKASTE